MTYKVISSRGEVFDIELQLLNNSLTLNSTISAREYLEFVNTNIETLELAENAKSAYSYLWGIEEQFQSRILRLQK